MLDRLIAAARALNTRENWNRLGIALSLVVIGFALLTLVHMLRGVEPDADLCRFQSHPRAQYRHCRNAGRGGVCDADLLRLVRAANDRQAAHPLSHRGFRGLHQLFDRAQYRRDRVHRQRDPLPDLFRLRSHHRRYRQARFHHRTDILARQRRRARSRHRIRTGSRERDQQIAARPSIKASPPPCCC